ncbi:hypothetical protein [Actinotalea sp. JY-7876]|uniref:hypothetical protein n=1 Tax=Actinotalea sp. JY-7876 TaxID=2758442 RepID=UPI0015F45EC8|nr:hypothetical protein [Actinotalea sp. JY-7876]
MRVRPSVVGVGVAAALLLSGCAGDPSAAAVVDGRTITRAELEAAQADLAALSGEVPAGDLLTTMAVAPLYIDAAAAEGVGVSADQARGVVAQSAAGGPGAERELADSTVEVFRMILAINALTAAPGGEEALAEVDEAARELDIEVNPRYGEFDPESGEVVPLAQPWLVAETPEPAAE